MGSKTKISWCDSTWSPVTGCLHGCEYCYARRIATRFGAHVGECKVSSMERKPDGNYEAVCGEQILCHVLEKPFYPEWHGTINGTHVDHWSETPNPYPFDFEPTLHRYRLDIPKHWKKPRNIFVCSMADLFGEWVQDDWIIDVLNACREAPQHRYLFLTKNPDRYDQLFYDGVIREGDSNFWYGSTCTDLTKSRLFHPNHMNCFMSCEPMLAPWPQGEVVKRPLTDFPKWVILGAETGNRKEKVVPEKEWVDYAVESCRKMKAAVFMKESLRNIMGKDFVQEFPW